MHKGIKMICRAFETLHNSYRDGNQETKFHTPYKHLEVIKTNGPRGGKLKLSKPTIHNAPYLFNSRGICELSTAALSTVDSIKDGNPAIRPNSELIEKLHLEDKSAITKLMTLQKIKNIYRIENENRVLEKKSMVIGLPDLYLGVKKGSKKFKKLLLKNKKLKVKPWTTMNDKWNISAKNGRENYFEKVFSLWRKPYLPAKLQNFCLLHVNNRYNYNIQLSKYKQN